MLRAHLPLALGEAFSVQEALGAGVSLSRLYRRDLARPFHGVRTREVIDSGDGVPTLEKSIVARARQYATRMGPDEFFSHVTSAVIWGIPLPAHVLVDRPPDVAVFTPHRNRRGVGIRGHEVATHLASTRVHPGTGLRVASPASTWVMLGAILYDEYDLVAAGDAFVREERLQKGTPVLTTRALLATAVAAGRRVGVPALRLALPRVCTGSASRPETWLRLTVIDAGLPLPALNFEVFDGPEWIARVDLAYPELKIAIEYEGAQHFYDLAQWMADIRRYERLAEAGWRVIRVTKDELFGHPARLVATVRRAIAQRA